MIDVKKTAAILTALSEGRTLLFSSLYYGDHLIQMNPQQNGIVVTDQNKDEIYRPELTEDAVCERIVMSWQEEWSIYEVGSCPMCLGTGRVSSGTITKI